MKTQRLLTPLALPLPVILFTFLVLNVPAATRYVWQQSPGPTPPSTNWATAAHVIQLAVDAAAPGDQVLVTNGVYATGGRAVVGTMTNRVAIDRAIAVESLMGPEVTILQGYPVPGTTNGDGAIRCVYLANDTSLSGFTLTDGATRTNGDASIEQAGGGLWCESTNAAVSNCVLVGNSACEYGGGSFRGTLNNCSFAGNSAHQGGGAQSSTLNDCTLRGNLATGGYLKGGGGARGGTLNNCTLIGNSAAYDGGGANGGTLNNCTLTGDSANHGGGAQGGTLNNCKLAGNSAINAGAGIGYYPGSGGGTFDSTLNNCTLIGNSASFGNGGGADGGTLNNCIVYFNSFNEGGNFGYSYTTLNYCCTLPLPPNGVGNITNAPLFVDSGGGNLRLQSNSPCLNAGRNAYSTNSTDLDGNPRIIGGTVDIGAYEVQSPSSVLSYAWAQQYGLPTDGSADYADADLDGHDNWQEWKTWTIPTNAMSVLKLLTPQPATNGILVRWQSVIGHSYFLERATNAGTPFSLLQSNRVGQAGTTSFTDTNTASGDAFFYRVGVPE